MPPINQLIWESVKPILKLAFAASCGFLLTKAKLLPVSGTRSISQIVLNITLPSLLFAKIVPSFNQDNIKAIGPIVVVAILYLILPFLMGLVIRTVFKCPRNFRWGILSAAAWSNWGDLPTSVVQSVCAQAPFNGTTDSDLGIAYVAIFILVFYITLFPLGGTWFIAHDYATPYGSIEEAEQEAEEAKKAKKPIKKRLGDLLRFRKSLKDDGKKPESDATDDFKEPPLQTVTSTIRQQQEAAAALALQRMETNRSTISTRAMAVGPAVQNTNREERRRESLREIDAIEQRTFKENRSHLQGINDNAIEDSDEEQEDVQLSKNGRDSKNALDDYTDAKSHNTVKSIDNPKPKTFRHTLWRFIVSLFTPPTISLVIAIICALVDKLKALFVYVDGASFNPTAPDGDPPLGVILDTTAFIGAASVPLGLLLLGSALARMKIPRPVSRLPLASILALAVAKLVILPVFGYFFVLALTNTSLVDKDNHVLIFVLTYFSCVPSATTQIALTQIFAPEDGEDNSNILAAYLIIQYIIFALSSVVLTAVTLSRM